MSHAGPHPFDPLSGPEIELVTQFIKKSHGNVNFHVVTLQEPRKADMKPWLENPQRAARPARVAEVVIIKSDGKVFEGLVNLSGPRIIEWKPVHGEQPIVSLSIRGTMPEC